MNYLPPSFPDKSRLLDSYVICITGASKAQKVSVKDTVEKSGGVYLPNLEDDRCTHLLVWKRTGNRK